MRKDHDFSAARKNRYASQLKKQIADPLKTLGFAVPNAKTRAAMEESRTMMASRRATIQIDEVKPE